MKALIFTICFLPFVALAQEFQTPLDLVLDHGNPFDDPNFRNELETPSGICAPGFPIVQPPTHPNHCSKFQTHEQAERNWYHCAEGVAIMGAAIYQLDNNFIPVLSTEDFSKLSGNQCDKEIYPDSGICYSFPSHLKAEQDYAACQDTNFQYWDYLQFLMKQPVKPACQDGGDFFDGAYQGALWKPQADPKAKCKNGTTMLLPSSYASSVNEGDILDVNYNKLNDTEYFGLTGGRPRFCLRKAGAAFGNASLVFRYKVNGVDECRVVKNASNRED